jgi:hypothetical protein
VIGQELHLLDVVKLLEAVDLNALVIVDVRPLLLSDGIHVFGVQPLDVVHGLLHVDLALELLRDPVECGHMATSPAYQEMPTVAGVVDSERK